ALPGSSPAFSATWVCVPPAHCSPASAPPSTPPTPRSAGSTVSTSTPRRSGTTRIGSSGGEGLRGGSFPVQPEYPPDRAAGLVAEAGELLVGQQLTGTESADLDQRRRPARIVEGLCQLSVPVVDEPVEVPVPVVVALAGVGDDPPGLLQDPRAKALQGYLLELPEQLPVQLLDLAQHERSLRVDRRSAAPPS